MAKLTKLTQTLNNISENVVAGVKTVSAMVPDKITWNTRKEDAENKTVVINSAKDLTKWINSMLTSVSPNTTLLLQTYLQVLNYVSTPVTTGMMVDNLIVDVHIYVLRTQRIDFHQVDGIMLYDE